MDMYPTEAELRAEIEAYTAMEAWEEYDEEQLKEHYAKRDRYYKIARQSYILQDYLITTIDEILKNSAKERTLFRGISQYADRNVDILSSPYFTKNLIFSESDENLIFNTFGIDRMSVAKKIKEMPKPPTNTGSVNVTPFRAVMIFIIGHYARTKEYKKMEYIYRYYAYSQFATLFYSIGFRKGVLKPEAMEYAVDNMDKKYNLKRLGSVEATMTEAMKTAVFNFLKADVEGKADFRDLSDFAVLQLAMSLKSRQAAWMKKIYAAYKEALDSGKYTSSYADDINEDTGDVVERQTMGGTIQQLADKYTLTFFTTPIMANVVKVVVKRCDVSDSEIRACLNRIWEEKEDRQVKQFLEALFKLFFDSNPKYTEKDIHSAVFGASADAIFRKSNLNDPLIKTIKDITNEWLTKGSNVYRGTSRAATKSNYKRAIYLYFVFMIMWKE